MRIDGMRNWEQNSPLSKVHAPELAEETARLGKTVADARDVARSALTNDRFGRMLERISAPASSIAPILVENDGPPAQTDINTAQARYRENSDN